MPKYINLGNGEVLIGLDKNGQVKDFYYPYAGLERHVTENLVHKIGVFADGVFSWIDDGSWNVEVGVEPDTMASDISAVNRGLGVRIHFTDILYNEKNVFIREVKIKNLSERARAIKIYFNQQFNISQTYVGDTAYFDPREEVLIHYKGRRVFLANAICDNERFREYSTGLLGIEGKTGTYKDAEDGQLSGNPIEHGQVDSVLGLDLAFDSWGERTVYYWLTVAKSIEEAKKLDEMVVTRGAKDIIDSTKNYWRAWIANKKYNPGDLGREAKNLFDQSLFIIRSHTNKNGSIIASGDSDLFQYGRDTYAYFWPRDATFCATALQMAGDLSAPKKFYKCCRDIITEEGYFMHKYRPDKALGSSWHPWVINGEKHFPIQEDETALVLIALWQYYELSGDLEFIEEVYNSLIKKAAEFMSTYRDGRTGLPGASYDIWERVYGINTYTSSSVYGALISASKFARLLGKKESEIKYQKAAEDIKRAILKYLYSEEGGYFYKQISYEKGKVFIDNTIDCSSFYGVFRFGILEVGDDRLEGALNKTLEKLEVKTEIGGLARFEGDDYHYKGGGVPGNPWINTTLWIAQYYIAKAKTIKELDQAKKWILWAVKYKGSTHTLPEQLDPFTGEHLSASPLTWSHAEFIITTILYINKLNSI